MCCKYWLVVVAINKDKDECWWWAEVETERDCSLHFTQSPAIVVVAINWQIFANSVRNTNVTASESLKSTKDYLDDVFRVCVCDFIIGFQYLWNVTRTLSNRIESSNVWSFIINFKSESQLGDRSKIKIWRSLNRDIQENCKRLQLQERCKSRITHYKVT